MMSSFYKSREMKTERMSWGKNVREQIKSCGGGGREGGGGGRGPSCLVCAQEAGCSVS